ncbi:calcium/sodium antiporter [Synechococcus sp. CCY9201]|uniref:calcium/sodium antiporter n=1 Tax=unclassified Synechococcus TaxID=2626047 RepID=UPI0018CE2F7B|nr:MULTISPECIES: calcium/sodium antiporter [unclassified Synechococcus]MEA5423901.1 calcium/sodium antiporter [Synechococcus sp. CCY9202]MEA5475266.1 calcium/sodium antiporter [Synechococcus sp. CCY9201]QPN61671.1 calcium/sodium antiporter [Synechococcus sp. CBW1002]QPN68509.1 calcium/sodium antiporter [Synechococcus sp. CBW1006]
MPFLISSLQIVGGILLLFGGGELFVAGSVAVALLLGIPQLVIGLTVVSLGTSAPELFVSLLSTLQGGAGGDALAVSNVVGSNIFNVLVVLGCSALVMPLRVQSRLVRRDVPLLLGVSMAVWGMASGGRLTWQAGVALLVGTVINLVWESRTASEHPEESADGMEENEASSTPVAIARLAAGLLLLVGGSKLLVDGATAAAVGLGVSNTVIGLTIVSAGTSMPELVTSVVAAYRGKTDLAIGNVVGSNLLNQFLILGICATVSGGRGLGVDPVMISRDLPIMVLTTLACLPIFWTQGVITRLEGGILVLLYGLYLTEQILSNSAPAMADPFRFVVVAAVLPLVLVFLVWQMLRWREQRSG